MSSLSVERNESTTLDASKKTHGIVPAAAVGMILLLSGCGDSEGPQTARVAGTVTFQGELIEGALLTFIPVRDGAKAQATTDAEGRFEVHTHYDMGKSSKPGMVAGEYRVTAAKLDLEASQSTQTPPRNLLPAKYEDPETSELSASVLAGEENQFAFDLE